MPRFTLPPLNYEYNALCPHIDEKTMTIHHTKHHATYISNLNTIISNFKDLENSRLVEIVKTVNDRSNPKYESYQSVRNHAGGHYNHSLFWLNMCSSSKITPYMESIINKDFDSMNAFKSQFKTLALKVFGSGWVFLIYNEKLILKTSHNQDTPISDSDFPILAFDVWEHAYYLKYCNDRGGYIDAFFEVIDWGNVEKFYRIAAGGQQVPINDNGLLS